MQRTPLRVSKLKKETTAGPRKKHKSNKKVYIDPMFLTEGDLDEIGDKVRDMMTKLLTQFEK